MKDKIPNQDGVFFMLVRRELGELGRRRKAVFLLIFSLMTFSAWIYAQRFRAETRDYRLALQSFAAQLGQITADDLADLPQPAVKPPWRLAFLADGGQMKAPNVYRQVLSAWSEPELGWAYGAGVEERSLSPAALDWTFLVRVVLSLTAFALSYDAICGPRQRAALRMLLSYPIARWQALAAKLVAVWTCLAVPFVCGAGAAMLILNVGGPRLAVAEWTAVGAVAALSLWTMAFYVLIGLLVSASSRDPVRGLAVLALFWVLCAEVIPAAGGLAATGLRPIPSDEEIQQRIEEIRRQVEEERGGPGGWRGRKWGEADDYAMERTSAATQNLRFARHEDLRRTVLERKLAQVELARDLAALSPLYLIQDTAERLAGSGTGRCRSFLEQAWSFRTVLTERVRELDAEDSSSPHVLFFRGYLSRRPVGAEEVPRFSFREASLREGLRAAGSRLLLLVLWTGVVLGAAIVSLQRHDLG